MQTKRLTLSLFLFLFLALAGHPAKALTTHILISGYGGSPILPETVASAYQGVTLPKFPPSTKSTAAALSEQFQISFIENNGPYNFVYFRFSTVTGGLGNPPGQSYKIEVSYQINDSTGFHDSFLKDFAYPGDHIDWLYTDGGASVTAQIVNDRASGRGSAWNHSGSWSWTSTHPNSYVFPSISYHVGTTFPPAGPNCGTDMPAQDTPGSSSHVATMNLQTYVAGSSGARTDVITLPMTPDSSVTPTSCSFAVTTGIYGPYQYSVITTYGGG